MCIAIAKPALIDIPDERLEICYYNNPDGAGFAYHDDSGRLIIRKGFFKFGKFLKAYHGVCKGRPMLIHFRIKTVGDKCEMNCHPFYIGSNSALVHNGTVVGVKTENGLSDSGTIARWIKDLNKKHPGVFHDPSFQKIVDHIFGVSRAAILTPTKFIMINRQAWKEADGALYSNDNFKEKKQAANGTYHPSTFRYNRVPPYNFKTGSWDPVDQYAGVHSITDKPEKDIYQNWSTFSQGMQTTLTASRDTSKRPHGHQLIMRTNDMFPDRNGCVTTMTRTEVEAEKDILVEWLFHSRGWNKDHSEQLSLGDLLASVGMFGMTATECLEQVTASAEFKG